MIQATNIMVGISVVLSLLGAIAWMKVSNGRKLQLVKGRSKAPEADAEVATQLLMLTIITSAFAALFAVIGWFLPGQR